MSEKITSPKSKGEKYLPTNSPQKNPKREYMSKKKLPHQNLREKNFRQLTHLRKIQRENIWVKKITSPKSKGKKSAN